LASETTLTTANDIYLAAHVDSMVLSERRPYNTMRDLIYWIGPANSNVADFPNVTDPGAGAGLTEGTGASNTAIGTGKATATLATVGMMATITDELKQAAIPEVYSLFGQVLIRSVEEKFQTDATALLDDFTNTTNTAGVALSYATLQEAVNQLAQRDVVGTPVGVLDPAEILEVSQDLGSSGAAAFGNPSFDISATNISLNASVGRLAGADWFQTSLVTSTGGGVFVKERALAGYQGWALRTEPERDASMPGTEIVATERYGLVEREDAAGETILS
jgi:hypothetical protein